MSKKKPVQIIRYQNFILVWLMDIFGVFDENTVILWMFYGVSI